MVTTPKVLIIDDSNTECLVMRQALQGAGYQVFIANDGTQGLRVMSQERPQCLVLDIVLPGISGFDVCRQLRSQDIWRDLPIIIVSTKNSSSDRFWAMRQGANHYLTKPFKGEDLVQVVGTLLNRHAEQNERGQAFPSSRPPASTLGQTYKETGPLPSNSTQFTPPPEFGSLRRSSFTQPQAAPVVGHAPSDPLTGQQQFPAQPSGQPVGQSAGQPSSQPAGQSARQPSGQPAGQSAGQPSGQPAGQPAGQPSGQPARQSSGSYPAMNTFARSHGSGASLPPLRPLNGETGPQRPIGGFQEPGVSGARASGTGQWPTNHEGRQQGNPPSNPQAGSLFLNLIPRRSERAEMLWSSGPDSLFVADRAARQLYLAIDGRTNVETLCTLTGMSKEDIFKALRILVAQQRIQLYDSNGRQFDSFFLQ